MRVFLWIGFCLGSKLNAFDFYLLTMFVCVCWSYLCVCKGESVLVFVVSFYLYVLVYNEQFLGPKFRNKKQSIELIMAKINNNDLN